MASRRAHLLSLFLLVPAAAQAGFWQDAWLDPALFQAQDLNGGTGFIHVPCPRTLDNGVFT